MSRISSIFVRAGSSFCSAARRASSAAAKLGAQPFLPVARRGERLLGLAARGKLALQRLLDGRPVDRRALRRQLGEEAALLRDLGRERFAAALELGQALAAAALGEDRLLRGPLGDANALAAAREFDLGLVLRVPRRIALASPRRGASPAHRRARAASASPCAFPAASCAAISASSATICTRRASAVSAACFSCSKLEIEVVATPLLRRKRHALVVIAPLRVVELGFDGGQRVARGERARRARSPIACSSSRELALPGEHAVQIAVRREEMDRLRA